MNKKHLDELLRNVAEARTVLEETIKTSKTVALKSARFASNKLNREAINRGLVATSKGIESAVAGLKLASKSATKLAFLLENNSEKIKKFGAKFNRKS